MFEPALYAQNPCDRWINAANLLRKDPQSVRDMIRKAYETWPFYWWGVANAWLVYLGPSPGNSAAKPINWEVERLPTLGEPHMHFKLQRDSTGFWPRLREWTINAYSLAGVFIDDDDAAMGSTLLANVLDTRQGYAGKISASSLEQAMPSTVVHLARVRPRIIVPMDKRVSRLLVAELKRRGARNVTGPCPTPVSALNQRYEFYRPQSWSLEMPYGPVLVAESPQHPSKRNFYDPQIMDIYLAAKIRSCI